MAAHIDAKRALVLLALGSGKSKAAVAAEASINDRTLRKWAVSDEQFAALIEVAIAKGRSILEGRIIEAAERDWRAAAWMLEVRFYGRSKSGPEEEQHESRMTVVPRDGVPLVPFDSGRADAVLTTLHRALGDDEFKRWLYAREQQIAADREPRHPHADADA